MKHRAGMPLFVAALVVCICPPLAKAQRDNRRPFINARILVQVRYASGQAAGQGIAVTLEGVQGEIVAQAQTDSSGKCTFVPPSRGVYAIHVAEPGYREFRQSVDLTITPTGFVTVELYPLRKAGQPSGVPPGGPGAALSVSDLAIPNNARKEFEAGEKLLMEKHEAESSIPHFHKAIQLHDAFPQAYVMLGMALMAEENWKEAQSALERAVQLDPNSAAAYFALGASLNQQKNYSAAEKALSRGLELNPDAPEGHYELAKTYWALGRWQEAEPHALKVVAGHPELAPVHVLLGNISLRKRDPQAALREYKEYLRLEPQGPMAAASRRVVSQLEAALPKN